MREIVLNVMTPHPCAISPKASVMDAATIMRECNIGDVIILEGAWLFGILTDRDIVVRALAEGLEPETTLVGEICSRELTTVESTASLGHAVRLMRENAIRRLPVVDDAGRVMGVVTISDVAPERDHRSALADVGSTPPNL